MAKEIEFYPAMALLYDALLWPGMMALSTLQLGYRLVATPLSWMARPFSTLTRKREEDGRVALVAVEAGSGEAIRWILKQWWRGNPHDRVLLVHVPEGELIDYYPRNLRLELGPDNYRKVPG